MRSVEDQEFSVADPGSHLVIEFHPVEIDGDSKCIEHSARAWVTPEELLALPPAPSDRAFSEHLERARTTDRA